MPRSNLLSDSRGSRRWTRRLAGERGASLVSLMVAVPIMIIAGLLAGKLVMNRKYAQIHFALAGERLDAQRSLLDATDCSTTLPSQAQLCDGNTSIIPYSLAGATPYSALDRVNPAAGSNRYRTLHNQYRAVCTQEPGVYRIHYQSRLEINGAAAPDPLLGVAAPPSPWTSLFGDLAPTCATYKTLAVKSDAYWWNWQVQTTPPPTYTQVYAQWNIKYLYYTPPLLATDLDDVDLFIHSGGVNATGGQLGGAIRWPTGPELTEFVEHYINRRMNVVVVADDRDTISAGITFLNTASIGSFYATWGSNCGLRDWNWYPEAFGSSAVQAGPQLFRNMSYFYGPDAPPWGLTSPGCVTQPSAPAVCVTNINHYWGGGGPRVYAPEQICVAAYRPRWSPASGWLYYHGNAGVNLSIVFANAIVDKFIMELP